MAFFCVSKWFQLKQQNFQFFLFVTTCPWVCSSHWMSDISKNWTGPSDFPTEQNIVVLWMSLQLQKWIWVFTFSGDSPTPPPRPRSTLSTIAKQLLAWFCQCVHGRRWSKRSGLPIPQRVPLAIKGCIWFLSQFGGCGALSARARFRCFVPQHRGLDRGRQLWQWIHQFQQRALFCEKTLGQNSTRAAVKISACCKLERFPKRNKGFRVPTICVQSRPR